MERQQLLYVGDQRVYMKTFSQTHALQAVDLNSISNLYLVSLQPYVFRAEYGRGGV